MTSRTRREPSELGKCIAGKRQSILDACAGPEPPSENCGNISRYCGKFGVGSEFWPINKWTMTSDEKQSILENGGKIRKGFQCVSKETMRSFKDDFKPCFDEFGKKKTSPKTRRRTSARTKTRTRTRTSAKTSAKTRTKTRTNVAI